MNERRGGRTDETKRAIVQAAARLFASRDYDDVTMRQIAREAGCSHTAIYLYFKDKEALLHELAMGPLLSLKERLSSLLLDPSSSPQERLRAMSHEFIRFGFAQRTMYLTFFTARPTRVDDANPPLAVQRLRNELFDLLKRAVARCLPEETRDATALAYARITFYMLHGIVASYTRPEQPGDELLEELTPTFDLAIDTLLMGMRHDQPAGGDDA